MGNPLTKLKELVNVSPAPKPFNEAYTTFNVNGVPTDKLIYMYKFLAGLASIAYDADPLYKEDLSLETLQLLQASIQTALIIRLRDVSGAATVSPLVLALARETDAATPDNFNPANWVAYYSTMSLDSVLASFQIAQYVASLIEGNRQDDQNFYVDIVQPAYGTLYSMVETRLA